MNQDYVVDLINQAIRVTLILAGPMLGGAVVIGILVSLFQAVTQINEQTLSFIPKILIILGALVAFRAVMMDTMVSFTRDIIVSIPTVVNK